MTIVKNRGVERGARWSPVEKSQAPGSWFLVHQDLGYILQCAFSFCVGQMVRDRDSSLKSKCLWNVSLNKTAYFYND